MYMSSHRDSFFNRIIKKRKSEQSFMPPIEEEDLYKFEATPAQEEV